MNDPVCANCVYEASELNERNLCATCERAYQLGLSEWVRDRQENGDDGTGYEDFQ